MDKQAELAQRAKVISTLLAAFPATQGGSGEAAGRAYLIATEDFAVDAIEAAVRRFIKGGVPRQSPTFAPSAAELANECRLQKSAINQAAKHIALPPPSQTPMVELSPEQRAEMAQRLLKLAGNIGTKFTVGDPDADRDAA